MTQATPIPPFTDEQSKALSDLFVLILLGRKP